MKCSQDLGQHGLLLLCFSPTTFVKPDGALMRDVRSDCLFHWCATFFICHFGSKQWLSKIKLGRISREGRSLIKWPLGCARLVKGGIFTGCWLCGKGNDGHQGLSKHSQHCVPACLTADRTPDSLTLHNKICTLVHVDLTLTLLCHHEPFWCSFLPFYRHK